MKNDSFLKRWFQKYNERYFENSLPDAICFWEPAFVTTDTLGEIREDSGTFIIRIDPAVRFAKALAKLTLLHEMAHLKLWPDVRHGKKFNAEMIRLAQAGALNGLW